MERQRNLGAEHKAFPHTFHPRNATRRVLTRVCRSEVAPATFGTRNCTDFSAQSTDTPKKLLGCTGAVPSQWSGTNYILQTPFLGSAHGSAPTQGIYNRSKVCLSLVLQRTLLTNSFLSVQALCYAWQHEIFFFISRNHPRTRLAWQACSTSFTYESILLQYKH